MIMPQPKKVESERRWDPRGVRRIVLGFGLGFLFAGLAMIVDVYRAVTDVWPGYVAILLHFASIGAMLAAWARRIDSRISCSMWAARSMYFRW